MISFEEWLARFENGTEQRALDRLDHDFAERGLDRSTRLRLRRDVLDSCYHAAMFTRQTDQHEARRRRNARTLSATQLRSHKGAVTKLMSHVLANPAVAEIAFGEVVLSLGIRVRSSNDGAAALFVQMLDSYSRALRPTMPFITAGPMLHRFRYGCLLYAKPLEGRRNNRPDSGTMLLFDLVQIFRLCSSSKRAVRRQCGEQMPQQGDPHFSLAAALVNAALDEEAFADGAAAENRLKHFLADN